MSREQYFPLLRADGTNLGVAVRPTAAGFQAQTTVERPWVPVEPGHLLFDKLVAAAGPVGLQMTQELHAEIARELYEAPPATKAGPQGEDSYQRQWRQHMDDLCAAMEIVQENSEFFDARVGDDKIKIIGDFFTRWATEKLADSDAERQALAHQFVGTLPNSKSATPGSAEDHEAWGVFLTSRARALHHFHSLGQSFDEIARTLNFADGEHVSCVFEATRHTAPNPWVPDDSGAWAEVASDFDPKTFFTRDVWIACLLAHERQQQRYIPASSHAHEWYGNPYRASIRSPLIVAYKVVSQ